MKNDNRIIQIEVIIDGEGNKKERYIINNPEEIEIITKAQKEAYQNKKKKEQERLTDQKGDFVMGQNEALKELEGDVLTPSERRQFLLLTLYMKPGLNPLMKDGKPLTTNGIAEIWGVARENASRRLNKFAEIGLIKKSDTRPIHFYLNEKYFRIGAGETKRGRKFVKVFQRKLNEVNLNLNAMQRKRNLHKFAKKKVDYLDAAGLLQVVMPYFHYQTYYLVENPDDNILLEGETVLEALENRPKQLKHLTKTAIGQKFTGNKNSRNIIDRNMKLLQKAGALMVLEHKGKTHHLIHPHLMYRTDDNANDNYTRHILAMFNEFED